MAGRIRPIAPSTSIARSSRRCAGAMPTPPSPSWTIISVRCCRATPRPRTQATRRRSRGCRGEKRRRPNDRTSIVRTAPAGLRPSGRLFMIKHSLSRRTFLGGAAASPFVLSSLGGAARGADITVGIIYVGSRQDYGWNQAHAVGAQALKEIPGVKVVEEENVPETVAVAKTMESMINIDGATLQFPTSFGYFNPFMIDAAKKYPKVEFRYPTSLWQADKHPANAGGYFCYLDQGHYVNGIAAGLSTKSNKIGYIAAKPIPLVLRNVNSFM